MPRKLGNLAIDDIRRSIGRCTNSREISAEAARLSAHYEVGKHRIYELTGDIRDRLVGSRKARSDKGTTSIDLRTDENWKIVNGFIELYDMDPAEAYRTAIAQGKQLPISFETMMSYRRRLGLGKKQSRVDSPHRRFEASAPGEIFQFDVSGVKERWFDQGTRRIIKVPVTEVSKNHPNTVRTRVPVWRFAIIDDYSRRVFVRYYAIEKESSSHVVDFLLQAYAELGVPLALYTDNAATIRGRRTPRATEILNKVLVDQGGYKQIFHAPGNARATGKIERFHRECEKYEKAIGQYIDQRGPILIEEMNEKLAPGIMHRVNNIVHSSTGQSPLVRWDSAFHRVRRLDYAQLHGAFMVDEFTVKLRGDLTFSLKGETFQLPTGDVLPDGRPSPFLSWALAGRSILVVFPDNADFFTVVDEDRNEYDIRKSIARPDVAGEFRATAESSPQKLRREYRKAAKEDAERQRNAWREQGTPAPIPIFDEQLPAVAADTGANEKVRRFPAPEVIIEAEDIAAAAPGRAHLATGFLLDFWGAEAKYASRFASPAECRAVLDTVFSSRSGEQLPEADIEAAIDAAAGNAERATGTDGPRRLKAV